MLPQVGELGSRLRLSVVPPKCDRAELGSYRIAVPIEVRQQLVQSG